jgi:hypothetical protein
MLLIRPDQMQAFQCAQRRAYAREVAALLRARYPDACDAAGHALEERTAAALDRAAAYGFATATELETYAALALLAGARLGRRQDVQRLLEMPDVDGWRRLRMAAQRLEVDL